MRFINNPENGAHTFEFDPFAPAETVSVQQVAVAPQPANVQAQQSTDDVFVLVARRVREKRAEVTRLRVAEAELAILEKMVAAAGITVEET